MTGDEAGPPDDENIAPPSMVRMAAVFYAGMTAVAFIWAGLAGRLPLWLDGPPDSQSILRWSAVGVLGGLWVVIASRLMMRLRFAQDMATIMRQMLGPLTWWQAFLLAVMSAIGEELLFRGAMQPTLGLELTCLIFALMHWPMSVKLVPWTISAGIMGYAFGWSFDRSGHVLAPVIAHFVINFINLHALSQAEPEA